MNYPNWIKYEIKGLRRNRYEKKTKQSTVRYIKRYANRDVKESAEANRYIYDAIINKKPFFAGRIGGNEMNMIAYYFRNKYFPFRTDARKENLRDLCSGAGFFPNDVKLCERYVDIMCRAAKQLDIDGIWSRYMEEWFLCNYAQNSELTWLHNLEPWNVELDENNKIRWTYALKGKKVLVIHPFSESIKKQYEKRELIFQNIDKDLLPEFELLTFKAVQSIGGSAEGFENWFEALDYMLSEIKKIDFDVAIIGCGAYGFPLGAEIKKMGKCAIHLGGAVQLLFGIRGKRWDNYGGVYENMINESWVRPSEDEVTPKVREVEGGCYC